MSLDVQESKYIIIDLFPAEVEIDGTSHGDANKIVVTDNRVYMIQDAPYGPFIAFQEGTDYASFDRLSIKEYTVKTETGKVITFRRAEHCACGSRLRGVQPFIGIPHAALKPIKR